MNLWWAARVGHDAAHPEGQPFDLDEFTAYRLRACLPRLPRSHLCWFATQAAMLVSGHEALRLVECQDWSKPTPPVMLAVVEEVRELRQNVWKPESIVLSAWSAIILGHETAAIDGELMAGMIACEASRTHERTRVWPIYKRALRTAYWSLPPDVDPPREASHHRDLVDAYNQLPGRRGKRRVDHADWLALRAMSLGWTARELAEYAHTSEDRIFRAIRSREPDPELAAVIAPCAARVPPSLVYPIEDAGQTWWLMLKELALAKPAKQPDWLTALADAPEEEAAELI